MKQYKLTNWTMENHQSIFGAFVLRGLIQGHATIADGTEVRTTAVTSMDNEQGLAYTHHSGCFAITTDTMSPDWAAQVTDGGGTADSFLQDSFEVAPFQDETYDDTSAGDGTDIDAVLGGEGGSDVGTDDLSGDGSNDGLDGDDSDADLGGLPPGLLALLQSMGDDGPDDALAGDDSLSNDAPAPKRARKSRAKASA